MNTKQSSILIIYTGGTIGMVANKKTGALENFGLDTFRSHVPELDLMGLQTDIVAFDPPIDSSDMSPQEWVKLVSVISENYHKYDGFVVLHGTDTMAYTASAISFMLKGLNKPVILTGSQLPIGRLRTDGKENLLTSIEIAAARKLNGEPMVPEVCIYFDSQLMRGNRTMKINSEGFNAFRSFNYPPLAVAGINIKYEPHLIMPYRPDAQLEPIWDLDTHIMMVNIFPGIQKDYVEAFLHMPNLKALIIKTFGAGNAPQQPWLIDTLCELDRRGVVVVNTTQCNEGAVEMNLYKTGQQLLRAGLVNGHDATMEATLTKLMVLLGRGYSQDEVKLRMQLSLCGEITPLTV